MILKIYIAGGQRSVASHNLLHRSHERNHIPCGWLKVLYMQVPILEDEGGIPVVTRESRDETKILSELLFFTY